MTNQNQKGISSLLSIIIVIAVAVLAIGGVLAYQYWWAPEKEAEVETPKIEAPKDKTADWKTYRADKYGVSFSYPPNFQIVTDKIQIEYIGHPKGFNWYRIELTDTSAPEKPFMRFEIDPDGYGPFFPDKAYQITENSAGKIVIGSVNNISGSENSNDGKVLIIPNVLESSNGHSYYWQFSYNESGKDYEPLFKQILSTFKFSK